MIYAISVIKGFNSFRGNMLLHVSMAITMLVYIRVPAISHERTQGSFSAWWNNEEEVLSRKVEIFPAADLWYTYNVVLHFLAAFIQIIELFISAVNEIESLSTFFESLQLLMIIMQVFNFILIMTYYTTCPDYATLTPEYQVLLFWVFIEGSVVCGTIATVMGLIMIRSFERFKINLSFEETFDHQEDFLST